MVVRDGTVMTGVIKKKKSLRGEWKSIRHQKMYFLYPST
jgi:hypothetical protein